MNNQLKFSFLAATLFFTACQTKEPSAVDKKQVEATLRKLQEAKHKNAFAGVQFATLKDTTCGMPLGAGVEDTLVLDKKVYGFCSQICKEEFARVLKAQHKR